MLISQLTQQEGQTVGSGVQADLVQVLEGNRIQLVCQKAGGPVHRPLEVGAGHAVEEQDVHVEALGFRCFSLSEN